MALLMTLAGCSTGPYAPPKDLPSDTTVIKTSTEVPLSTPEKKEEKQKPAPKPEPVDLSIGPRDAERSIDLSVDGPILIPREVFEE